MDTLSGQATFSKLLYLFWKVSTLKENNLLPWEQILSFYSIFFFPEGFRCAQNKQEVGKVISLIKKEDEITKCIESSKKSICQK